MVPQTPAPIPVGWAGAEVEGSWARLWEKRKRQRTDPPAQLPGKEPECRVWAEGNLPRFLGVLGLAGNQSPGWQDEGGQWNQPKEGGPWGEEGEVSVNHIN